MNTQKSFRTILLTGSILLIAAFYTSCTNTNAQEVVALKLIPSSASGFEQKELPYEFDALEPYIDAQTMELHYSKHHAGYTSKFNAALAEASIESRDIFQIFSNVSKYPAGVRNNGGGYFNHSLFWNIMAPDSEAKPSGKLLAAIDKDFGSFDEFKELFSNAAATQFGSGWAWLIVNESGSLQVVSTLNQDNPLMDVADVRGTPVLNLDVWEHAYYLKYQNKRKEYIGNFWNLVNWDMVEKLYLEAI